MSVSRLCHVFGMFTLVHVQSFFLPPRSAPQAQLPSHAGYLRERQLVQQSPVSSLQNVSIGFDGVILAKDLGLAHEPLLSAIGGLPASYAQRLDAFFDRLKELNVTPTVVFGGLLQKKSYKNSGGSSSNNNNQNEGDAQASNTKRHLAWKTYEMGNKRTAAAQFADIETYVSLDLQQAMHHHLASRGVSVLRAPGPASAQLAWMQLQQPQFIHAAYGSLELLLYGVRHVISHFGAKCDVFEFAQLPAVLADLGLSQDQLVDVCLLSGWTPSVTFPPLIDDRNRFFFSSKFY
jgi:hypothetical protein